jgi:peptidoglycan biosynthesis protein MviN/MurJ (putative lipid II flippase)
MKLKPGISTITFWVTLVVGLAGVAVTALNMIDATAAGEAAGILSNVAVWLKALFLPSP